MAGFMIDNIAKGTLKQWHLEDMDKISKDKDVVLLDVRTVGEFNRGHMDGFKNIPVDELRERINEVEKEKPVYLICQSGLRSYIASRILEGNGYETYNFSFSTSLIRSLSSSTGIFLNPLICPLLNSPTVLTSSNTALLSLEILSISSKCHCFKVPFAILSIMKPAIFTGSFAEE